MKLREMKERVEPTCGGVGHGPCEGIGTEKGLGQAGQEVESRSFVEEKLTFAAKS